MSEPKKETYTLFGRKDYAAPLEQIDIISVSGLEALAIPERDEWVELVAIPETAMIKVIPRPDETI